VQMFSVCCMWQCAPAAFLDASCTATSTDNVHIAHTLVCGTLYSGYSKMHVHAYERYTLQQLCTERVTFVTPGAVAARCQCSLL
jgi:hypothetical protein